MAVGGADAVRTRVAPADHHDVLVRRPEIRNALVTGDALVLQRQELHREVHAVEIAPGYRQVARLFGSAREHHRLELRHQLLRCNGFGGPIGDAFSPTPLADEDAGAERHAFRFHLIDPAVDQPFFHLEIGDAVAQQAADAVVLLE